MIKLLIDMNLSPAWVEVLGKAGIKAVHWSQVGSHGALVSVDRENSRARILPIGD